ncbi:MAG: ribosomal L7Ae/L30e/S12e/Gadd45 family protein [Clostridia bacterium]|nr:ribosomal L7Ae/L30e/S12e/Gadd45 family protein [Clostridia bacterium]
MSETVITDEKKLLSALGLCARARKITIGVPMICEALKRGGEALPRLVFEASDTSENTHKRISDRCGYYNVRQIRLKADGMELALAIGKASFVAAVALADERFCTLAEKYIRFDG